MGNNINNNTNSIISTIEEVNRSSFEIVSYLGKGGFGKVWKVRWKKKENVFYAMKEISKAKIIDKKVENLILNERDLLEKMNNPFIVNMYFSFQDSNTLYLVMDLIMGGDLRELLYKKKAFTEEESKFYIASTILGLEYMHSNNIIHRDIKPENLLIDSDGYIKITDFGIATEFKPESSKFSSGTPGYMAPEAMHGKTCSKSVDFFALGIVGYEFMKGIKPYLGKTSQEIKKKLMEYQAYIKKTEIPDGWGIESADCINRLIQRKPSSRLGYNGVNEIKNHLWFRNFNWNALSSHKLKPPYIPEIIEKIKKNENLEISYNTMKRYKKIMSSKAYKTVFKPFLYFNAFDKNLYKEQFAEIRKIEEDNRIDFKDKSNKSYTKDVDIKSLLFNKKLGTDILFH